MYQKLKHFLNRRTIIKVLAVVFILYAGFSTVKVIGRNYQLQQDVDHLRTEIDLLKLQNQELEYKVAYYKTDAFTEKEARDKLGLQAPGEKVVVFSDKIPKGLVKDEVQKPQGVGRVALSNLQQWLYFLFKKQPSP